MLALVFVLVLVLVLVLVHKSGERDAYCPCGAPKTKKNTKTQLDVNEILVFTQNQYS